MNTHRHQSSQANPITIDFIVSMRVTLGSIPNPTSEVTESIKNLDKLILDFTKKLAPEPQTSGIIQ